MTTKTRKLSKCSATIRPNLDRGAALVDTGFLAVRWNVSRHTVLKYCRAYAVPRVQIVVGGKILFRVQDVIDLEARIFGGNLVILNQSGHS